MSKFCVMLLLGALLFLAAGCASEPVGSREFVPGKGWVPAE